MNRIDEKKRTGVALSKGIVDELDEFVNENYDLGLSRSEVINAILDGYFSQKVEKKEKTNKLRGYIIKMRKRFSLSFLFL